MSEAESVHIHPKHEKCERLKHALTIAKAEIEAKDERIAELERSRRRLLGVINDRFSIEVAALSQLQVTPISSGETPTSRRIREEMLSTYVKSTKFVLEQEQLIAKPTQQEDKENNDGKRE